MYHKYYWTLLFWWFSCRMKERERVECMHSVQSANVCAILISFNESLWNILTTCGWLLSMRTHKVLCPWSNFLSRGFRSPRSRLLFSFLTIQFNLFIISCWHFWLVKLQPLTHIHIFLLLLLLFFGRRIQLRSNLSPLHFFFLPR